jgi:peroxiredoxin
MRSDIAPGNPFPDYALPDHTKTPRRLSDLQSGDPLVVVLIRGFFCPKDRVQLQELARFHRQLVVGTTRLVTITTDDWHTTNNLRQQLDAHWPFLYDEDRTVQQDLDIEEYTDTEHDVMIPHTIVLRPGLEVHRVYNGYYYWGRPSTAELHQDLREVTKMIRDDWDPTDPALREAWENGDKEPFYPYGEKSMERVMQEMAGAVDQYAGRADSRADGRGGDE